MDEMAKRIHQKRIEIGYTMKELADKVGVQPSAVNKWEKGIVSNIPRSRIELLANALECTPVWLMGIEQNKRDVPTYVDGSVEVLDLYARATPEQRKAVLNLLRSFVSDQE